MKEPGCDLLPILYIGFEVFSFVFRQRYEGKKGYFFALSETVVIRDRHYYFNPSQIAI